MHQQRLRYPEIPLTDIFITQESAFLSEMHLKMMSSKVLVSMGAVGAKHLWFLVNLVKNQSIFTRKCMDTTSSVVIPWEILKLSAHS